MRVVQPAPRRVRGLWSVPLPPPPPSPLPLPGTCPSSRCSSARGPHQARSVSCAPISQSRAAADAAGATRRGLGEIGSTVAAAASGAGSCESKAAGKTGKKLASAGDRLARARHISRAACPRSNPLPSLSLALRVSFERVWRRRLGRGRDGIVGAARGRDERRGAAARRRARRHVARRAAQDAHQLRLRPAARGRRAARQPGGGGRRLGGRGKARQDGAIRARGEDGAWEREEGQRGGAAGREEEGPRAASARAASPPPPLAPRARPSRRSGRL